MRPIVTYGGHECCQDSPDYTVTRTDVTGSVAYRTCTAHRDECAATAVRYAGGWGDVTVTVERTFGIAPTVGTSDDDNAAYPADVARRLADGLAGE